MFNDFMKNKNGIPSPEKIYLITSLTVSAAALSTTCLLEHISKQAYQKEKNQTTKQEEISIEQENTTLLSTEDEEVLNLMPYFKEEANALYKEHAEVVYHDKLYHLKDLYTLTNEEEYYLCYLDKESYYYCDLDTNAAIAINGYEYLQNYEVKDVLSLFPYKEKYGTPEESLISEEDFIQGIQSMTITKSSAKTLTK